MVNNHYVKCSICNTTFRLRTQIGYSNIAINFNCPKCGTLISGVVRIPEDPELDKKNFGIEFIVDNANQYETKSDLADYVVELSSEFLQQKVIKDEDFAQMSPFMRTFASYGEPGIKNLYRLTNALNRLNKYKNELKIISDLWSNEKLLILVNKANELSLTKLMIQSWDKPKNFRITNALEMLMVVHQARVFLLSPFIEEKRRTRIHNYPTTFEEIYERINRQAIEDFAKLLGEKKFFIDFEKRMHELTLQYIEILPDLIPLLNSMDRMKDDITSGKYTISTKHVKTLTAFYGKTYELFCDKIDLIIGMNNIDVRGNIDTFCISSTKIGFEQIINSYQSKFKKITSLLCVFDKFTLPYTGLISNKIRNAEGHFSREFNIDKNSIKFIDSHQGRESILEIDYLEFCSTTLSLFNALNELFEVSYQMDKFYRVSLHIK